MYTFRLIVSVLVAGVIWTPSPLTAQARGVTPPAPKVPLVVGLVVVGAVHEPSKGDYESIIKIDTVSAASFGYTVSGDVDGRRFTVNRKVRTEDLAHAHEWRPRYKEGDPAIYPERPE
ncbi:MAG: hypothetical protein M3473_01605 [Chloroflexota bacterium]|nr:hypothetical protein [Acidobacteriota bacterium]MDQ3344985.1 hypothetical protein [Chloroflexota bacterium]